MYTRELEICKKAVNEASVEILEVYNRDFKVYEKADESPVTKADIKAHRIISKILNEAFDYYIISEESSRRKQCCATDYCWIVDPIDGTKEFIKKNGEFTINIALLKNDDLVFSMIYAPVLKEMYYAIKGEGAYYEYEGKKQKIYVSDRTKGLNVLISQSHQRPRNKKLLKDNARKISKITALGSSLKGCRIARGDQDVYYRFGPTCIWDTAAMELIVEEAGGFLLKLDGTKIDYRKDQVINPSFFIINKLENEFEI